MELFKKIRALRVAKGIKQIDIAAHLGISQSSYTNYENGKRRPNYEFLMQLADYYEVTLDEIFGRNSKIQKQIVTKELTFKSAIHKDIWNKLDKLHETELYILDGYLDGMLEHSNFAQKNRKEKTIG